MQKEAVIVGHNYNSILGIARALGTEGYKILAIRTGVHFSRLFINNIGKMPEAKSKYIISYKTASTKNDDQVIDLLINQFASKEGKRILFPVDDRCAEIVDRHYNKLEPFYYLPNVNNQPNGIIKLMDKYYQKQLAKSVGLPVPEGWSVKIEKGKYIVPEDVTFPCFIKAEQPMGNRKKYMRKCDNYDELKKALDNVADYRDCVMLIEEFVEIEKEYGTVGMCNHGSVCIPGITEKTTIGHGSQAGVTVCGKIHLPSDYEETYNKMKAMMAKTELQGLFDIDLYESNGVMYFNELNLRMGGEGVGTLVAGANLALMLAKSFLTPTEEIDYDMTANSITFTNERPLSSDYGEGYISFKEYRNAIKNNDFRCVRAKGDQGPYFDYLLSFPKQFVRRIIRKSKSHLQENNL